MPMKKSGTVVRLIFEILSLLASRQEMLASQDRSPRKKALPLAGADLLITWAEESIVVLRRQLDDLRQLDFNTRLQSSLEDPTVNRFLAAAEVDHDDPWSQAEDGGARP